ncbi:MAG: type III pantothenate kinase [Chloroflexi bacterium]|nr:type III pantothenate kinase [Chloroflexota bacterium]
MLLAIDIGNTNITLGVWHGREWQQHWRLQTNKTRTADEYGILLKGLLWDNDPAQKISQVIIASVVPTLTQTFSEVSERYLGQRPFIVTANANLGLTILTDVPEAVGTDRLVNAVAASVLFSGPSIIIDIGTATKLDVVSANREFLGGVIAPGLQLAANALSSRAARLSHVALEAPPSAIGRNTIHAMQSGLILGYVSLIEGMVGRLRAEHPDRDRQIHILGTGGLINLITPHTTIIDHVDPWLTLMGLQIIHDRVMG